jgi:hypothetical protein
MSRGGMLAGGAAVYLLFRGSRARVPARRVSEGDSVWMGKAVASCRSLRRFAHSCGGKRAGAVTVYSLFRAAQTPLQF